MRSYITPSIEVTGSLRHLTKSTITKTAGSGDVIVIGTTSEPAPGSHVTNVS